MKLNNLLISGSIVCLGLTAIGCKNTEEGNNRLVILHTNDTHSAIEPNRHDLGGVARRKVLIDSVRNANSNVMLIDAGDVVQGSLYYTLFKGEVERKVMNELGYDIQILGNHEFDNGMEQLAKEWKQLNAVRLSSNYDFSGSALDGLFVSTVTREFGDKKIGFIGINLDPAGIITESNYTGVKYLNGIDVANAEAAKLKADGADMVIAVTHIGYHNEHGCCDVELAKASKDIDIIIGGHSHTFINPTINNSDAPSWRIANAEGDTISVLQTGSSGVNLGEIDIDLDTKQVKARLITVDKRLDNRIDGSIDSIVAPYRQQVEDMRADEIGATKFDLDRKSPEMLNLLSDFVRMRGAELCGKPVDLSIMNKGGIRNNLPAGKITKGGIIDIAPFDNSIVVIEIKGCDLIENFKIMAAQDGQGVSGNVEITYDSTSKEIKNATINGRPVNPDKTYRLATINYLADGNDYMTPLKRGTLLASSPEVLYQSLINYISAGKLNSLLANPDKTKRMRNI